MVCVWVLFLEQFIMHDIFDFFLLGPLVAYSPYVIV